MVRKLGFKGFPDFQTRIYEELETTLSNPIAKHDRWANDAPDTHILNRFAEATIANLRETLSGIKTVGVAQPGARAAEQEGHEKVTG